MTEIIFASIMGGVASSLRYYKQGSMQVFRIFVSSVFLAYFAGADISALFLKFLDVKISNGAVCFFVAYIGSSFLDRSILIIKAFQVSKKWES
jgi:uncharacterized membrane protein YfcA